MILRISAFSPVAFAAFLLSVAPLPSALGSIESDLTSHLGGATLLTASLGTVQEALTASCSAQPRNAGAFIAILLKSRSDADVISPKMVQCAIKALGADPAPRKIAEIVYNAVRVTPDSVLEIVHEAVLASPEKATVDIVTATVAAVPDPYKEVTYRKIQTTSPTGNGGIDGKTVMDGKSVADGKDYKEAVGPEGERMPLAEAIARTAADARPGPDAQTLMQSIDYALAHGVGPMFDAIAGAERISAVGNAGDPNYGNEPFRLPPGTRTHAQGDDDGDHGKDKDPSSRHGRQKRPDIPPVSR